MSQSYVSQTYHDGYTVSTPTFTISSTGLIEGSGLYAGSLVTLDNFGTIDATGAFGVTLAASGIVINGSTTATAALIEGASYGVTISGAPGTVVNYGTILGSTSNDAAVDLNQYTSPLSGGRLVNGSTLDTTALISGSDGVDFGSEATVANYGSIVGLNFAGIHARTDTIVNGSTSDTAALVKGGVLAIEGLAGNNTLSNFGTLIGGGGARYDAVVFGGGNITNGSAVDTVALITGGSAIKIGASDTGVDTLTNFGTILATADPSVISSTTVASVDVYFVDNGSVINKGLIDATGINSTGVEFVSASSTGDVSNSGTIAGTNYGVQLQGTGVVVNSGAGALIQGGNDGIKAHDGSVTNQGAIKGGTGWGIYSRYGAYITNGSSGLVSGGAGGIDLVVSGGTILNSGTLDGTGLTGDGVFIGNGGATIDNSGGLIEGVVGLYFASSAHKSTVSNSGTIEGTGPSGFGVKLVAGGLSFTNNASGLIEGKIGLSIGNPGYVSSNTYATTITNYGTIEGSGGTSVLFGSSKDVLVVESGSTLVGVAYGDEGTLIFGSAAGAGTVSSLGGSSYSGFSTYEVAAGAHWTIEGPHSLASGGVLLNDGTSVDIGQVTIETGGTLINSGLIKVEGGLLLDQGSYMGGGTIDVTNSGTVDFAARVTSATIDFNDGSLLQLAQGHSYAGVTIRDFAAGDTIDLTGVSYSGTATITHPSGHLIVSGPGGTYANIVVSGLVLGGDTLALKSDGAVTPGTEIVEEPACFLGGTRLLTDHGEVAVEDLRIGDRVVTLSGEAMPVRWIGRRRYDPAAIEIGRERVLPIVIRAGALDDNVPARDLLMSPGHALYLGDVLVPAEHLVNGCSVLRRASLEPVQYFHIELDHHSVILAEGAAAESYIDSDNRWVFENAAERATPLDGVKECAPRVTEGPEVDAARAALAARLPGFGTPTLDRDPHLLVDGQVLRAASIDGTCYRFLLEGPAESLRLVSRSSVPAEVGDGADNRRLGVPLVGLVVECLGMRLDIPHAASVLGSGFHAAEAAYRWTDGDAALPSAVAALAVAGAVIELHLAETQLPCWIAA